VRTGSCRWPSRPDGAILLRPQPESQMYTGIARLTAYPDQQDALDELRRLLG
jgi:hypothetical protein